eukprot:6191547-Pleurochrysis_carterae.AAC.1
MHDPIGVLTSTTSGMRHSSRFCMPVPAGSRQHFNMSLYYLSVTDNCAYTHSRALASVKARACSYLLATFTDYLEAAESEKGEKQSAANNEQGHQKTPAMIKAVLTDALRGTPGQTAPRGGFTDVGLHTGGLPRNTMWPL